MDGVLLEKLLELEVISLQLAKGKTKANKTKILGINLLLIGDIFFLLTDYFYSIIFDVLVADREFIFIIQFYRLKTHDLFMPSEWKGTKPEQIKNGRLCVFPFNGNLISRNYL
jgi:hypothetical protein